MAAGRVSFATSASGSASRTSCGCPRRKRRGSFPSRPTRLSRIDEEYRITLFNEGAERIFGYSAKEAIGSRSTSSSRDRLRDIHRQHVGQFATGSGVARRMGTRDALIVGRRKNGEEFPAGAAISKLEVAGTRILTVVLRDITYQKRIENEQRFLAEVGPVLATSLDYEETLSRIAELAVQGLADLCIVDSRRGRR